VIVLNLFYTLFYIDPVFCTDLAGNPTGVAALSDRITCPSA